MPDAFDGIDDDDDEIPDETPAIAKLRNRNKELVKEAKRAQVLEEELASYKRRDALRDSGVALNETQKRALELAHEGEWTPDAVRATAVGLGWAEPTEQERNLPNELDAQDRIAGASSGGRPDNAGVVTPDDVAGWSTEKAIRFAQKYPHEWEGLKRGEEAVGVTF